VLQLVCQIPGAALVFMSEEQRRPPVACARCCNSDHLLRICAPTTKPIRCYCCTLWKPNFALAFVGRLSPKHCFALKAMDACGRVSLSNCTTLGLRSLDGGSVAEVLVRVGRCVRLLSDIDGIFEFFPLLA